MEKDIKLQLEKQTPIEKLDENINHIKKIENIEDMKDQNLFLHTIKNKFAETIKSYKEQIKPFEQAIKEYKAKIEEIKTAQKEKVLELINMDNKDKVKGYYGYSSAKITKEFQTNSIEKDLEKYISNFLANMPFELSLEMKRFLEIAKLEIKWKINPLNENDLQIFKEYLIDKTKPESISVLSIAYNKSK